MCATALITDTPSPERPIIGVGIQDSTLNKKALNHIPAVPDVVSHIGVRTRSPAVMQSVLGFRFNWVQPVGEGV